MEQSADVFQQFPGDLGVALHERPEIPERHDQRAQVGRRGDGRCPDSVADQRDLTEVAPGPDLRDLLPTGGDHALALGDDEEAHPVRVAFLHDHAPGGERPLAEVARQALEVFLVEPREERDLGQQVGRLGHVTGLHYDIVDVRAVSARTITRSGSARRVGPADGTTRPRTA